MGCGVIREYWIVESALGNAFTTFKSLYGCTRVRLGPTRIGPFESVSAAADWLQKQHIPHASYVIEEVRKP